MRSGDNGGLVNQEHGSVSEYFRRDQQVGGSARQAKVEGGPGKWKDAHDGVLRANVLLNCWFVNRMTA